MADPSTPKQPLNIVYLHSHDTGRYISPYGHAVDTPHLQRFAESGVLFRNAFCASPTCSPSRACLLTGQYAHTNGMTALAHRGGRLHEPRHTLPNHLKTHGYQTVLAGFEHIRSADPPQTMCELGYTHDLCPRQSGTGVSPIAKDKARVEAACGFLDRRSQDDPPFFLDVGFFATHRLPPEDAPGPRIAWHNHGALTGDPRYVSLPPTLPDTPASRRDFADYAHAVRRLDRCYGRLLDTLERQGLSDRTLVIITTDHGIAFPGMKCSLTAHGTGVLLMMRGPGLGEAGGGMNRRSGRVLNGLVSQIDVFPTLCDLVHLPKPDHLQGLSLQPVLHGTDDDASVREAVFAEVNTHIDHQPMRSVRTSRYSYIRRFEEKPHVWPRNIDDSVSKVQLDEVGLLEHALPREELFDLYRDPTEACNRAEDPEYAQPLAELRERLDQWMADTHDPMASGWIARTG